jgi:hypothetical protein
MTDTVKQTEAIKAHLEEGNTITAIEALNKFGCFRLASRIHDLKTEGYVVDKIMVTGENNKRYAQYFKAK